MARRAPRSIAVSTTVTIDEQDYEVSASLTKGTENYFDKSFGNWLPGDPDEIEDVTVSLDGEPVDYDALPESARKYIDEKLVEAAEEDAIAAQSDEDDRRCDAARDARWERDIVADYRFGGDK